MKPRLLLDIDGVLNPLYPQPGFSERELELGGRSYRVRLSALHGEWLRSLADDYRLCWATSWNGAANTHVSPWLGLPELPLIELSAPALVRPGVSWKLEQVAQAVGDEPLAWLDDDLHDDAVAWAREREAGGIATLLCPVEAREGFSARELTLLREFAARLR